MTKTLFDHLTAIQTDKRPDYVESLSDEDKKSFSVYMINRLISMDQSYINIVNELQQYDVSAEWAYMYYAQLLPAKKHYTKYVKSNADKLDPAMIDLVCEAFDISRRDAPEYMRVLQKTHPTYEKDLKEAYGLIGSSTRKKG